MRVQGALLCHRSSCPMCAGDVQVSSFGSLPRAMSTAASLGETAAASAESRKTESSMSKVESIASTAVRAAAKMDVSLWPTPPLPLQQSVVQSWYGSLERRPCQSHGSTEKPEGIPGHIICCAGVGYIVGLAEWHHPSRHPEARAALLQQRPPSCCYELSPDAAVRRRA